MLLLPPWTLIAPPRSRDADGKGAHSNHVHSWVWNHCWLHWSTLYDTDTVLCAHFVPPPEAGRCMGCGKNTFPSPPFHPNAHARGSGHPSCGPGALAVIPQHITSPSQRACASTSEQAGGFFPKPRVNYPLLDNFQLPDLAMKGISSRWHAYLCTATFAGSPQPALQWGPEPVAGPGDKEHLTLIPLPSPPAAQPLPCWTQVMYFQWDVLP